MTIEAILRYLVLLDRDAIVAIAADTSAPLSGAALVLSAALARNHARHDLLAQPRRLLTPFAASLVTAAILFLYVQFRLWLHAAPLPPIGPAAWSFLGLYWATAPLAWLYGLPYEWLLGIDRAAKARLWALGIVSAWRIILITHVLAALLDDNWWAALAIVVFVESAIALAALIRFQISESKPFRPRLSSSLIDAMGGLMVPPEKPGEYPRLELHPPEEKLLSIAPEPFRLQTLSERVAVNVTAVSVFGVLIGLLANLAISPTAAAWNRATSGMTDMAWPPALFAFATVGLWLVVCLFTQAAQRRKTQVERFFAQGRAVDAVTYMRDRQRSAFPASWDPPPCEDFRGTPSLLTAMEALADVRPAGWVADAYAPRIRHYVSQPVWYWHYRDDAERLCAVLERLPNGRELAAAALAGLEAHEKVLNTCRRAYEPMKGQEGTFPPHRPAPPGPYVLNPRPAGEEPDHAALTSRLRRLAGKA